MANIVPVTERPNRERADVILQRVKHPRCELPARGDHLPTSGTTNETAGTFGGSFAPAIASTTAAAVREAIAAVAPYSSQGAILDAELEVQHRDESGAQTIARVKFTYGRSK